MTDSTVPVAPDTKGSWSRDLALLGLFFGALYFFMLGSFPLGNPDEGRYSEIPREMIASGDWVLPRLNGVVYFEKPPLVYWMNAIAFSVFGENEWSARAVPAVFGLAGVLMTYAAGRRLRGRRAGLLSAIVLGSSILYFVLSRILILDMVVSVFTAAALFLFILGVNEAPGARRRSLFYGLYVCAALATLSKGLIGVALPGAVMFFWLLIFNQWKRLLPFYLPTGLVLFLAIAAPWHVMAAQRNSEWAYFYFVHEHWLRFTTTTHGRYEPFWYFIPILIAGFLPWTGYLVSAVQSCGRGFWARRKDDADVWFLITWAVFIFLFFSKSQSKLAPYILPIFPAMAVLVGAWFARVLEEGKARSLRVGLWTFLILCGLFSVAVLALCVKPTLIRDSESAIEARPWLLWVGLGLPIGSVVVWRIYRAGHLFASLVAQVAVFSIFYVGLAEAYPSFHNRTSKEPALKFAELVRPGDKVYHWHGFAHDFLFYSKSFVGLVERYDELELAIDPAARASGRFIQDPAFWTAWSGPIRVWVLARDSQFKELCAVPGFQYHLIASNERYLLISNQP